MYMFKRFKVVAATLICILYMCLPAVPVLAATNVYGGACATGGAKASSVCSANGSDPITGANGLLAKVTRILALITSIAAIILVVIGGFMYVMSDGDSNRINTAKNTIIYALVGLVIVGGAQAIVIFVINRI